MKLIFLTIVAFAGIVAFAESEPKLSKERVVVHTTVGDLVLAFYPKVAPEHTRQILDLFRRGLFNGMPFFQIVPGQYAQFTGLGPRSDIPKIPLEPSGIKHERGQLSMARDAGDPDSADSSFTIVLGPLPNLDGKYTIFGRVVKGTETLDALDQASTANVRITDVEMTDEDSASKVPIQPAYPQSFPQRFSQPVTPPPSASSLTLFAAAIIALNLLLSVFICLWGLRLSFRSIAALLMLITLIDGFALFTIFGTLTGNFPWLGMIPFFGAIGLFRWLGQFESARFNR